MRQEILKWAQKRSGGRLPNEAMAGRRFELLVAGRNSSAFEVDLPGIHAWALRQEDPDKTVAGRIWTSEAILWRTPDRPPRFAARLIVASSEFELDIVPSAPGYIRQLTDQLGLTSGGYACPQKNRRELRACFWLIKFPAIYLTAVWTLNLLYINIQFFLRPLHFLASMETGRWQRQAGRRFPSPPLGPTC